MKFSWSKFLYFLVAFLVLGAISGYYILAASRRGDWFILVVPSMLLVGAAIVNGIVDREEP